MSSHYYCRSKQREGPFGWGPLFGNVIIVGTASSSVPLATIPRSPAISVTLAFRLRTVHAPFTTLHGVARSVWLLRSSLRAANQLRPFSSPRLPSNPRLHGASDVRAFAELPLPRQLFRISTGGGSRNRENHRDFTESTISQTALEIAPLSHPVISAKSSSTRHEFTQDFSKISPTARARSPTAVHGTWLEENSPPAGERARRAPRITPDSFSGSAGCAPGSPAPASAASRRLARSHAGRSTASGAWEAAALPCAARSSLAHGCVATSEHHGGHAHVLILRHVAPRLAHALGRLAAGGAAKRRCGK